MQRNDHPGGMFPPQIPPGWSPQTQATEQSEICFQLTLPMTRIGFGPFSVDPVEQLLGCSIAHLLEPAMTAPMFQRPSAIGPTVNVYPLNLPAGEGLSIRLGQFGELGLFNDGGLLRLSVPWSASSWIQQRLAAHIIFPRPLYDRCLPDSWNNTASRTRCLMALISPPSNALRWSHSSNSSRHFPRIISAHQNEPPYAH